MGSQDLSKREWWLPSDGISREIMAEAIPQLLGPKASVRVGIGPYSDKEGFILTAEDPLTESMIRDLKQRSQILWQIGASQSAYAPAGTAEQAAYSYSPRVSSPPYLDRAAEEEAPAKIYSPTYENAAYHYKFDRNGRAVKNAPAQPSYSSYLAEQAERKLSHPSAHRKDSYQSTASSTPSSTVSTRQSSQDIPGYSLYYTKSTTTYETYEYKPRSDNAALRPESSSRPYSPVSSPHSSVASSSNPVESRYSSRTSTDERGPDYGRGSLSRNTRRASMDRDYGGVGGRPPASDSEQGTGPGRDGVEGAMF
ncbi:hypothetical protein IQ07DRAFT_583723 [Pyrenochaeta sp. DS3sAY3a]|nr:hypothetical protein IQ07DRAFT_583723 [Pyrenochaeta sp. DS3sAY3a]